MKRNAREHSFKSLINELISAGVEIPGEENLRKKIKNLKDAHRNEVNKVKKSMISGVGTDDVYKPKFFGLRKQKPSGEKLYLHKRHGTTRLLDGWVVESLVLVVVSCDWVFRRGNKEAVLFSTHGNYHCSGKNINNVMELMKHNITSFHRHLVHRFANVSVQCLSVPVPPRVR